MPAFKGGRGAGGNAFDVGGPRLSITKIAALLCSNARCGHGTEIDDPNAGTRGTLVGAINASDEVAGSYLDSSGGAFVGFLYDNGNFAGLGTGASAINAAGQVAGDYVTKKTPTSPSAEHGFMFSNGKFTDVSDPNSLNGGLPEIRSMNDSGVVVGVALTNNTDGNPVSRFLGVGNPPPNPPPPSSTTADMVLRGSNTALAIAGQYEIYDLGNNTMLAAYSLGQVTTDWHYVTLGGFFGRDTGDMLLRSASTGGSKVYDISNNTLRTPHSPAPWA